MHGVNSVAQQKLTRRVKRLSEGGLQKSASTHLLKGEDSGLLSNLIYRWPRNFPVLYFTPCWNCL